MSVARATSLQRCSCTTCGQPKPHSEAHRDTIGAWQPDRTACCARTGHGWGRQWWPAIRTSNGHLGAHLRCTLSSSCHSIALATAPGAPTPQHRFPDPQKLAAGFQLAFSRTGPKTVSCSPLPVVRFGGEHNVLSLHTHHRSSQDCTCRPAVAINVAIDVVCLGRIEFAR